MAIIKPKSLKEMDEKAMGEKLKELRLELSKDRASSEIGTVKNPGRIREMRRSIARVLTEQRKREIRNTEKKQKAEAPASPTKSGTQAKAANK